MRVTGEILPQIHDLGYSPWGSGGFREPGLKGLIMQEYPSDEILETIRNWEVIDQGVQGLLDLIKDNWKYAESGFKLTGKKVLRLELHTFGWSGNEEIVNALESNLLFYTFYWEKSVRGGHYYFMIRLN